MLCGSCRVGPSWLYVVVIVFTGACGGASSGEDDPDGDDPGVDAALEGTGRIEGTVWAPGNGPVTPELTGLEIPVANALVVVSRSPLAPIPNRVHCQQCLDRPGIHTFADAKGRFSIASIAPGDYVLTMQKGLFRRQIDIVVTADEGLVVPSEDSTLPGIHDEAAGKWTPRIALALGAFDRIEDILAKMGMAELQDNGRYKSGSASDRIDLYWNGVAIGPMAGTMRDLIGDLDRMLDYHIIFIPCTEDDFRSLLFDPQNLRNIRDYVAAGGKLYVTDWAGEWADNVFPEQIQLGAGEDTPAAAYDRASDTWNTELFGDADGSKYISNNAEVTDTTAHAWLDGQVAPSNFGDPTEPTEASEFTIDPSWNVIEDVHPVFVGFDTEGQPITDTPQVYVVGGEGSALPKKPMAVAYEPAGCGRVIYTTYHTTERGGHSALLPQERMMIYLIMEIGECVADIIIE